jgi:hypothetical protein
VDLIDHLEGQIAEINRKLLWTCAQSEPSNFA